MSGTRTSKGRLYIPPMRVPLDQILADPRRARGSHRRPRKWHPGRVIPGWRLLLPLVLAVQASLSLRLTWSNTAFTDEALYLRSGHLEIEHWLSGTQIEPANAVRQRAKRWIYYRRSPPPPAAC
jgi:hypothetical protein